MSKTAPQNLTEQQRKWFASLRDGLENDTGRSLAQWVTIAQTCPEDRPRARLKWFKETHGLLQNRASFVLNEAFPATVGWDDVDALKNILWSNAASRSILVPLEEAVLKLPEVIVCQRKGYSAWSRKYQFAALRPIKGGVARLGLALSPDAHKSLKPAKSEGWSERLKASLVLESPRDVNKQIASMLKAAWSAS